MLLYIKSMSELNALLLVQSFNPFNPLILQYQRTAEWFPVQDRSMHAEFYKIFGLQKNTRAAGESFSCFAKVEQLTKCMEHAITRRKPFVMI